MIATTTLVATLVLAGFSLDAEVAAGWDTNVFRTPRAAYLDPESNALVESSPTSAPLLRPKLELEFDVGDAWRLEGRVDTGGRYYFGDGNVANASGFSGEAALWLGVDPVRRRGNLRKITVNVGAVTAIRDYRFLHRGDGSIRRTGNQIDDIEEGDRYRYRQAGLFVETQVKSETGTRVSLEGGLGRRDYTEVGGDLESNDQDRLDGRLKVVQDLGDRFMLSGTYTFTGQLFVSRRANTPSGGLQDGVLRRYLSHEARVRGTWEADLIETRLSYTFKRRGDIHADYRSYTQHKARAALQVQANRWLDIESGLTAYTRTYDNREADDGSLRTRQHVSWSGSVGAEPVRGLQTRLGVEGKLYEDGIAYYTYARSLVYASLRYVF